MSEQAIDTPAVLPSEPGIYPGLSWDKYAAIPLPSASTIEWAGVDGLHLKAALDGEIERKDTAAFNVGRALHLRLLEPELYPSRVLVREPCGAILGSGERKGEVCGNNSKSPVPGLGWRCGSHGGKDHLIPAGVEIVNQEEADHIETAAAKLKEHQGERLRRHHGEYEVAMIADIAGVRLKARLDKWIPNPPAIIDIKKVAAATSADRSYGTSEEFGKRIATMGYGFRAALYLDIAKQLTGKVHRWFWLVVEDGPPFSIGVYEADEPDIRAGRNQYMGYLTTLKQCRESNNWPGFTRSVETVYAPDWWRKQYGGHT